MAITRVPPSPAAADEAALPLPLPLEAAGADDPPEHAVIDKAIPRHMIKARMIALILFIFITSISFSLARYCASTNE